MWAYRLKTKHLKSTKNEFHDKFTALAYIDTGNNKREEKEIHTKISNVIESVVCDIGTKPLPT